ncbi:MAG: hypothetical protein DWQ01_13550 [Planctomycetota bacterium]|nr:MAG: hypothetical protein DWQ01_13550 [Planctomycetota bacterium]
MNRRLLGPILALASSAGLLGCFNSDQGQSPLESDKNATGATLRIEEVTNGFGRLLPHVVHAVDPITGAISPSQLVEIRSFDDLLNNPPSDLNPVLPPATWPTTAINPGQATANHFVAVRFSRTLRVTSVLDPTAGGLANNGLTGSVTVVAYDPATGFSEPVKGRGFINGFTYFGNPPRKERWVASRGRDGVNVLNVKRSGATETPGIGYPGTNDLVGGVVDGSFVGAGNLVSPVTFVFVVDEDDDLSTYETFPADRVIRIVINESVRDKDGRSLDDPGVATSSVGNDAVAPVPLLDGVGGNPVTLPANLAGSVACDSDIRWSFSESCQPHTLGPLPSSIPPSLSPQFTVEFEPPVAIGQPPPGQTIELPYTVLPISPFDFTEFVVDPVTDFPGSDPFGATSKALVTYFRNAAVDLFENGDPNSLDQDQIEFTIGDCPGLVNVPVAPGAIYVASNGGGQTGGLRVIDLDGFGQGTGDPTHNTLNFPIYDVTFNDDGVPIAGDISKFPFNPNLNVQGIFPPLSADTTSLAGGSRGVFQLAQDSSLRTQLVDSTVVGTVGDMTLGHPLDLRFNNFDCLSGGFNNCATSQLQQHPWNTNAIAAGNDIAHAPHPNPPRIRLAPSCFAPLIQTEEPSYGGNPPVTNLLGSGNAFGFVGGQGPSGLLTSTLSLYAGFWGPAPAAPTCPPYTLRQQVGHFLYVLDTSGDRVVVLNSNRMTVLDSIPVSDPDDMSMAPDMNLLAVSNKGTNTVSFVDTNPNSPNFHTVVKVTSLIDNVNNRVGIKPTEICWQPDDEDILVICEGSNSMAIISSGSLTVRKIIPGVNQPKLLAVSNRDVLGGHGFFTGLYYAYVVSQSGSTVIFESGPDGIQGIGFDDFVGIPSLPGRSGFDSATAMQPDPNDLFHGVFIAYRNEGKGSVAHMKLQNAPSGPRSLAANAFLPDPNFRSKEWAVDRDYINAFSSDSIADIAVDDLSNRGGMPFLTSSFGSNKIIVHSSKSLIRNTIGIAAASDRQFLFAANSNGRVDVINLSSGQPFTNSIVVPGASVLCHYWRQ